MVTLWMLLVCATATQALWCLHGFNPQQVALAAEVHLM